MDKREKELRSQIKQGEKSLLSLLNAKRRRLEADIIKAVSAPNFATNASVRARLYNQIATEYVELSKQLEEFTTSRGTAVAKDWFGYARSDIKGAK